MDYYSNHLKETLKSGEKQKNEFKIGVEIEHFVVDKNSWDSINYYQENGIETLLKKLMKFNYTPQYEEHHLIGLEKEKCVITIEPGGQLEISMKACLSLQDLESIYFNFLQEVIPILEEQNQYLLALGYHPKSKINEIPFIPKKRYQLMASYFGKKGNYAHHMMKGTAALQVSIDYQDEEDFVKKIKVANFISPILAIISDNSPIFEGEVYQQNSLRSLIWKNTDSARSDTIPGLMEKSFGYQEYVGYVLNVEPILFLKDNCIMDGENKKASQVMEQNSLTNHELEHFFSMVFPAARARNYIEIRPGDSLPYPFNFSYIAMIKGLFYNDATVEYLYQLSKTVDSKRLEQYKKSFMANGLDAEWQSKTLLEFLPHLFDLAREGLPLEEAHYLQPLEKLLLSKQNVSQRAKEKIRKEGLAGLWTWTANNWIQEDEIHENKAII